MSHKPIPISERFWKKVEKTEGCWLWKGATNSDGYGHMYFGGGRANAHFANAHRIAWTLANGDIPEGMHVLHHCDNPACVNPDHLWIGTNYDNVTDKMNKGRHLDGIRRGIAKRIGQKFSAARLQKMSASAINKRAVEIHGIIYPSMTAAGKAHGITRQAIYRWINIGRARVCTNTQVD